MWGGCNFSTNFQCLSLTFQSQTAPAAPANAKLSHTHTSNNVYHTPGLEKKSAQLGTSTNPVDQCDITILSGADKAPDVHEQSANSVHVGSGGEEGDAGGLRNGGQHIII